MNFIRNESAQKLRGGYYTPDDLAQFIARWVCEIAPQTILEPSCGDGAFFEALSVCETKAHVTAFELDRSEAGKAIRRAKGEGLSTDVRSRDFLQWAADQLISPTDLFDAAVGNPPFIRYQYLPTNFQNEAERIFDSLGLPFTKHTNAWVPFVLSCVALLRPGGRIGMIVPSEIVHVMHAQSLRTYLGLQCERLVIIDPEEIWFKGTLQGAVILLAEKKEQRGSDTQGLGIHRVRGREFALEDPAHVFAAPKAINGKTVEGKWTRALLDAATLDLLSDLEASQEVARFKKIANVDVGIVTGANKFFLTDDKTIDRHGLRAWAKPMFGRSEHCPGVIYDWRQHYENAEAGLPTNFLHFPNAAAAANPAVAAYVADGERQELHTRFKCRIRKPWFSVPSVYATEIGMLKRAHDTPRLILNRAGALTTDTAYRIRTDLGAEKLVRSFINPLTALSAELEGRHYGGGVLELVPSEIERLLIPLPTCDLDVEELDTLVRRGPMPEVLDSWGWSVLKPLGLTRRDHERLFAAWLALRNRRCRTASVEIAA